MVDYLCILRSLLGLVLSQKHRDALLRWSQVCVIPAHKSTTSNHTSGGFKGTAGRARASLLCVSTRREWGKSDGGWVWGALERPGDAMKSPQCDS